MNRIAAWFTHMYTASGICFGFLALHALSGHSFRTAMGWLLICLFVDATDGILARSFQVKRVIPWMSGKRMDALVDFSTYALIPAYFVCQSTLVPAELSVATAFYILLISLFYYGKEGMIREERFFAGFPVLWNLVGLYLFFVFSFDPIINLCLILFFGILHFIPIRIPYPSRGIQNDTISFAITMCLLIDFMLIVLWYPEAVVWTKVVAVTGGIYFTILTVIYSFRKGKGMDK